MRLLPWRRRCDGEIAEEINAHLEMAVRDRIERGEDPDAARAAALREFGNVPLVRQTTREVWSWTAVEHLLQDLRFGVRILWHSPGLSATAVLLVALVVGANTTVYSLVHGILTRPAHGVEAKRLVYVGQVRRALLDDPHMSYANFADYAAHSRSITRWTAWSTERFTVGIDSGNYAVFAALVTPAYFDVLGIRIAAGRAFRPEDDRLASGGLTAVISDRLWRERFEQAADTLGQAITVNGNAATIVGIAPPRFHGATLTPGEDVWIPIRAYYEAIGSIALLHNRERETVVAAGQLASNASLQQAKSEIAALASQLQAAYPELDDRRAQVIVYSATALAPVGRVGPYFLALFSVITLLTLLIVSANVANLMLARAIVRQREVAVRQSLGASRGRIVRMLFAEGLAVSLAAWAAAFTFAWWTARALVGLLEPSRQGLLPDVRPDWQVAGYAMVLAMMATIAFTTAPALRTWRQPLLPWLKAGEQSVAPGRSKLSNTLVVLQLAFSVLLLTSAGLAYRSLSMIDSGDVGFNKEQLLLVTVRAGRTGAWAANPSREEHEATFALLERVRERLTSVADVEAVSYGRRIPGAYAVGRTPVRRSGRIDPALAIVRPVGADYLRTLGLTPIAGRDISAFDRRGGLRVGVINQHLATALWPGESPLGHTLSIGDPADVVEIVGVAPNAFFDGPSHDLRPNFVFVAQQQARDAPPTDPSFFVRYGGSLDAIAPSVGKAIAEVDASLPIVAMATMTQRLESVTEIERMLATLLVFFAAASLLVAVLGQYAIAMFNMRRRTRDFGVRLALGASAAQIQRAVVREGFQLTLIGLAVGFVLSIGAGTAARSVLIGVTPTDPPTYIGVTIVLATAAILASYLPAWRAARGNVVDALRQE